MSSWLPLPPSYQIWKGRGIFLQKSSSTAHGHKDSPFNLYWCFSRLHTWRRVGCMGRMCAIKWNLWQWHQTAIQRGTTSKQTWGWLCTWSWIRNMHEGLSCSGKGYLYNRFLFNFTNFLLSINKPLLGMAPTECPLSACLLACMIPCMIPCLLACMPACLHT